MPNLGGQEPANDAPQELQQEEPDRLSNLPDILLHRILSSFLTRKVMAFSILSTRWRSLCMSVPSFDFEDPYLDATDEVYMSRMEETFRFVHFVHRALIFSTAPCIHNFRLECHRCSGYYAGNLWLTVPLARGVQELETYIPAKKNQLHLELGPFFFTSKTLVVLNLHQGILLNVPFAVSFPSLKKLFLYSVGYYKEDSVERLLGGCPVLEELVVERLFLDKVLNFKIRSRTLKSLRLDFSMVEEDPAQKEYNLEINAPAIEYLRVKDPLDSVISVGSLPAVAEAHLKVLVDGQQVVKLLGMLHNVSSLSLSWVTMEVLEAASSLRSPLLNSLVHLRIDCSSCDFDLLLKFLENCPFLQFLNFKEDWCYDENFEPGWTEPQAVPKCLTLSLKTFCLESFEGSANELKLIEYILRNAPNLETMTVHRNWGRSKRELAHLLQPLMNTRASKLCKVLIK